MDKVSKDLARLAASFDLTVPFICVWDPICHGKGYEIDTKS
jgi:hypothetical protein